MQPQYPQQQPQYPPTPQQPYAAPQYPPAPPSAPQYPPAAPQQPQYPPAQPPAPQYGPPPGYPPPPQYGPPPGYPPQYQQQPVAQPAIAGTLDQFYSQPSTGGGKSLAFEAPGTQYIGIVTRPVGNSDITQQTDTQGRPAFFRDGRPKFVMKVPLQLQPSATYPDGLAQWYVKGAARDELVRAMAEAGAPEGPPEANAVISITMTGTRPSGAGMNPTKLFRVDYRRPQGAQPVAPSPLSESAAYQPVPPATQLTLPGSGYQPAPEPVYATNSNHHTTSTNGAVILTPPAAAAPAAPVAPPPPVAAPPVQLSTDQQALLAKLTGQPSS